jgi:hypothetical protein
MLDNILQMSEFEHVNDSCFCVYEYITVLTLKQDLSLSLHVSCYPVLSWNNTSMLQQYVCLVEELHP